MKILTIVVTAMLVVAAAARLSRADYHAQAPVGQSQAGAALSQVRTAITHAGFAGGGSTLSYVQQHLGHALNCLEGTRGKNFNAGWGHPCQGQGNGVLADLRAAPGGASFMLVAEAAGNLAVAGLKSRDLAEARNAARGVAALLTVIADNLK